MKLVTISAAFVAAATLGGAAGAADLAAAKSVASPAETATPWGGLYLGANLGYAWDGPRRAPVNVLIYQGFFPQLGAGAMTNTYFGKNGVAGGAQVGYNAQIGPIVIGAETDITFFGGNGGAGAVFQSIPHPVVSTIDSTIATSRKTNWLGTARVRGGFTPLPNLLIYATGGLAYGKTSMSYAIFQNLPGFPATSPGLAGGATGGTKTGYAIGGGLEYLFSPNWTARLEYLYYDLGSSKAASLFTYANVGSTVGGTSSEARFSGQLVRLGVNYKFGAWGGPVVAKY